MNEENALVIPDQMIISKIYIIRDQKVMLDSDLAELYGVETKQLKRSVYRNEKRFPPDFMFELTREELENLRCQIGTSSWGGVRYLPFAFTEQGVAMLSSILNTDRAIRVNIQIIRVFTRMRHLVETHSEILRKLQQLEKKDVDQDQQILLIFEYLNQLEQEKQEELQIKDRKRIGFKRENES
jgi:phage regulator Rha-like protein